MKLSEIVKIGSQPAGFSVLDFDLQNAKLVGSAENIPIYHLKGGPKNSSLEAFALKIDNIFASILAGEWGTLNGKAFYVLRTYTLPEYRNKGLITALYSALYSKLKIKLVSDFEQSPETITIWKKLAKVLPVKVINIRTKEISDIKDVPEEDIFGDTEEHRNIRLMIEQYEIAEGIEIPEVKSEIMGGILKDNIHYTHLDDIGKYI